MEADTPSQESDNDVIAMFEAKLESQFGMAPAAPEAKPAEDKKPAEDSLITDELTDEPKEELIEEDPPEAKVFKVKVDGQEIEVPEDELVKGY